MTPKINLRSLKRLLPLITLLFLGLVVYFLARTISGIRWAEIEGALREMSWESVAVCLGLTVLNYMVYAFYDVLSFLIIGPQVLKRRNIIPSTMIALAFNLNLGALIGSIGLRYRIYSGWGIPNKTITHLTALSVITSWSGYVLLLGLVFFLAPSLMVPWLHLSPLVNQGIGALFLSVLVVYLVLCARGTVWNIQDHDYSFPRPSQALLQFFLSTTQWSVMALIIHVFLQDIGADVGFDQVLLAMLVSGIAGVITHIPAGLGVLEAIFLRMLQGVTVPQLVAALICYRFVYYLVPLLIAVPGYLYLEYYQKKPRS